MQVAFARAGRATRWALPRFLVSGRRAGDTGWNQCVAVGAPLCDYPGQVVHTFEPLIPSCII